MEKVITRNIKLTIEYDGTRFRGWQIQQKTHRTVQGEIQKALKQIFQCKITLNGSGRTDTGVHAAGQVAHFKTKSPMPTDEMLRALNANLPEDIAILKIEEMPTSFHARYDVKSKTYRYRILNRSVKSAHWRNTALLYPYPLNVRLMREEAISLMGRHDFKSFQASDPRRREKYEKHGTFRTIKRIDIKKKGEQIVIDVEADGFLYKMVRNIVGTLLEIGSGRLPKGSMKDILKKKSRISPCAPAKPHGLVLIAVKY